MSKDESADWFAGTMIRLVQDELSRRLRQGGGLVETRAVVHKALASGADRALLPLGYKVIPTREAASRDNLETRAVVVYKRAIRVMLHEGIREVMHTAESARRRNGIEPTRREIVEKFERLALIQALEAMVVELAQQAEEEEASL